MADESNTGGAPDGAAATAAETPVATPAANPPTPPVEVAAPSKEDWAGLAKSLRTIAASLPQVVKPAEAAKPASTPTGDAAAALAEVASLRFELGLRDAMSSAGIVGGPLADLITKAAKAEKPDNVNEFVAKYAALGKVATATAAPVVPPVAPSNTGAPRSAGSEPLSGDPRQWPADVVSKMSNEAFRKALNEFEATEGRRRNPFAGLRKR